MRNDGWLRTWALGAVAAATLGIGIAGGADEAFADDQENPAEESDEDKPRDVSYDRVEEGDTLATLALEHEVPVEDLQRWNDLDLGELEPGMRVVVDRAGEDEEEEEEDDGPVPVIHRIEKGDTLRGIASEYNVSVSDVKRWNRRLDPRRLQLGDRVRLYVPGANGESVSYGSAANGRLYNGVALKSTAGLEVRSIAHAYGTRRVIRLLRNAVADVKARWPNSPDIVVGHLSYKNGGAMSPHKSHESGRDADASYYYRGNVQTPDFYKMTEETFDARKTWHLFKTLIDTGEVEFIFVSYYLQKPLYEYARSIGYTEEQLAELIQYPASKYESVGVIRHSAGHDDHFHIRFTCGPKDRHCQ